MKQIITSVALFISVLLGAQEPLNLTPIQVPAQAPHATQEKCYAGILHQEMLQSNPDYALKMQQFEQQVQLMTSSFSPKSPATYVIPVVFHVMHLGEAVGTGSNVSDEVIEDAVKKLNEAYRNQNNQGGADTQIEFALAVRNPSGDCTNGIVRTNLSTNNTYKNQGVSTGGSGGSGIAVSTLMGSSRWDATKYYNIYIVSEINNNNGGAGVQGFAYMAAAHGTSQDGAVFMASCVMDPTDKTLIHELGHALNLHHTFEGDNNGNSCPPSGANQGDMCADTPPHRRSQSDCNDSGTNSCDGGSSNKKFVYNYMDYSSNTCMRLFTADQATRMQTACAGIRKSFFNASNLALVGPSAPTANVAFPQQIYCSGTVTLLDNSTCVPNTYTGLTTFSGYSFDWSVTNGTDTKTSTAQNPTFTLTSPGWYDVTYTVTGPNGTDTKTYSQAFYYVGASVTTCTPNLSNQGPYGVNISNVTFHTINSTTSSLNSGTYEDFICSSNTVVDAGSSYPISVTINSFGYTSYMKVYIDWNDNGSYAESEVVLSGNVTASGSNQVTKIVTGNVAIPASATKDKLLRMRVVIDAQAAPSNAETNCTATIVLGDVENYGVMVKDDCPLAVISTQPQNVSICPGENATFNTSVTDADSYQWQVSTNNGSTWTNVTNGSGYTGATTQTLSLSNVQASYNDYKYRLKTTNACGDGLSSVVTLKIITGATITTQPANATLCEAASNTFKVVATDATTYQWQVSTDNGTTWTNVTNGSGYSGATTANLAVSNVTVALSANLYRCVISSQCGAPVNSNNAKLTVNTKPTVSLAAFNTVCVYNSSFSLSGGTPAGGTYSGAGVTSGTFNPGTAGKGTHTITYSVSQNGCSNSTTAQITVDECLGVENITSSDLIVYPNPVSSTVNIGGNVENYQTAILIDIQGRIIQSWDLNKTTQLDLSAYGDGAYFIKIIGQTNSVVSKIELIK